MNTLRNPNILRPVGLALTTLLAVGATACTSKKRPTPPVLPSVTITAAAPPTRTEQMSSCTIAARPLGNKTQELHPNAQDNPYPVDGSYIQFGDGSSETIADDTVRYTYLHAGSYTVAASLHVQNVQGLPPSKGINCAPITITVG